MDINERLQQEQLTGGSLPQINPDEQNRYLGTFRERVVVAIRQSQVDNPKIITDFTTILSQHPEGKLLIDANLTGDNNATYIQIAGKTNHPFTLLSDNQKSSHQADSIAVLLAADYAVNIDNIYLS
ncbi:YueI family protein [Convivina praedatoris]|uniref:DUF1694 domain-containing protein n=1 Tax=Convivina praedatoris TaxID=2880963 RepID=A0ABN8HAU4_9LACO|nr:YueI family protein [Convivina sp. LMG 32447]CAH1856625.1 putative protein YueI [Convivina sp. LMG 32447]CAH1857013.1 putative protein YueI [Convivina sp. LMG 32447]CAH1857263.1 putative protein YueI [Convivina sp. LMG 32447]